MQADDDDDAIYQHVLGLTLNQHWSVIDARDTHSIHHLIDSTNDSDEQKRIAESMKHVGTGICIHSTVDRLQTIQKHIQGLFVNTILFIFVTYAGFKNICLFKGMIRGVIVNNVFFYLRLKSSQKEMRFHGNFLVFGSL